MFLDGSMVKKLEYKIIFLGSILGSVSSGWTPSHQTTIEK
jgi:hypothetical protein